MAGSIHKHTRRKEYTNIEAWPVEISSFTVECFCIIFISCTRRTADETFSTIIIGKALKIDKYKSCRVHLRTTLSEFVFIFLAP